LAAKKESLPEQTTEENKQESTDQNDHEWQDSIIEPNMIETLTYEGSL